MFSTTLAAAVTGVLATASIPAQPAWQTNYAQAVTRSTELHKPMAVFIARGGADTIVTDGGISPDAAKLLQQNFVCVAVDPTTDGGKELAGAFRMAEGVVISTKSGALQALRHEGAVSQTALTGYLERFGSESAVATTVATTEIRGLSATPVAAPAFYPSVGGCANGRCGVSYSAPAAAPVSAAGAFPTMNPAYHPTYTPVGYYGVSGGCANGRCGGR